MRVEQPGASAFTELSDVPHTYLGAAEKHLAVNLIETGIDFVPDGGGAVWGTITGTLSDQTDLQTALNAKQATLVSGTNIKTVNGNTLLGIGDVTISSSVAWGGITGTLSSQTDLQTALDGKVDENAPITGGTNTKITYDAKGLVTAGVAATTADINDSLNRRYVTDAQLTVIGNTSGTNTGDNAVNSLYSGLASSKQDTLVSGTNIKTINGTTILGSGDLVVNGTTNLSYTAATRVIASDTGTDATLPLFTSSDAGLVPSSGGGATNFLRADGTWAAPAGGVSDGDKGDITVTASGATWTIDNGVVTLAKQADVASSTLFYRKTAGVGSPEVQTLATLKTDLGLTGTNSGDVTLAGTPTYITIAGQTITRNQINLTTDVTGDLPFSNLAQGTARSILGVAGNATADVASIQGTTDQVLRVDTAGTGLGFGTVATGGITNAAVTYAKLQNVAANSFLANATGSSATVQEIATSRIPLFASAITGTPSATTYLRGDGTWTAPSGSGDVVGPASATDNAIARYDLTTGKLIQNSSVVISDNGEILLAAGGTADAPIKYQSGTNLSAAEAGASEYDGTNFYKTIDTTSGRGISPVQQYFRLTATGGTISTIADYFGANSGISLVSGADYLIEAELFFLKTTAGTVTWTLTNTSAPTAMNVIYRASVATGISGSGVATYLDASIYNSTSASPTIVTASLTSAVNHWASFKIFLRNNTGTSFKIRATCSAGTITPGIGSFIFARRLPTANIGTFAA